MSVLNRQLYDEVEAFVEYYLKEDPNGLQNYITHLYPVVKSYLKRYPENSEIAHINQMLMQKTGGIPDNVKYGITFMAGVIVAAYFLKIIKKKTYRFIADRSKYVDVEGVDISSEDIATKQSSHAMLYFVNKILPNVRYQGIDKLTQLKTLGANNVGYCSKVYENENVGTLGVYICPPYVFKVKDNAVVDDMAGSDLVTKMTAEELCTFHNNLRTRDDGKFADNFPMCLGSATADGKSIIQMTQVKGKDLFKFIQASAGNVLRRTLNIISKEDITIVTSSIYQLVFDLAKAGYVQSDFSPLNMMYTYDKKNKTAVAKFIDVESIHPLKPDHTPSDAADEICHYFYDKMRNAKTADVLVNSAMTIPMFLGWQSFSEKNADYKPNQFLVFVGKSYDAIVLEHQNRTNKALGL
jgi:hypothetical protein